jgi:hypothetical protein
MSTPATPLTAVATPAAPATPAVVSPISTKPAAKLNALQMIEQELANFFRQREQAIANVHAVDGAIQATQHLVAKLKAEVEKGEALAKAEAEKVVGEAAADVAAVASKVVSIAEAVEKAV